MNPPPLSREFLHFDPPLLVGGAPTATDGVGDLALALGDLPRSAGRSTPPNAPVSRVALSIPSPAAAERVEQRLRRLLGRPETKCFDEGIRTMYWRGNRHGAALLVVPTHPDPALWQTPFGARVVLGAHSWEANYPRQSSCRRP